VYISKTLCHSLGVILVKFAAVFRLLYGPVILALEDAETATKELASTCRRDDRGAAAAAASVQKTDAAAATVPVTRDLKLESERNFLSYAVQDVKDFLLLMKTVMYWRYPFVQVRTTSSCASASLLNLFVVHPPVVQSVRCEFIRCGSIRCESIRC
jgi:hypothetical protein